MELTREEQMFNRLSENYFSISEMGNFALYGPQMGHIYHFLLYFWH